MGKHITSDGKFRSDKYRIFLDSDGGEVTDDKLVLSFNDPQARDALYKFANDAEGDLGDDIFERLDVLAREEG